MIVTLRAGHGHAEPGHAGRGHAIDDVEIEILGLDDAAFVAGHDVAVKAARDLLLDGGLGQQIAGDLLNGELAERHVRVEGVHDPFAPEPHVAQRVIVVAAGVAVAGEVEPRHGQALAEMRALEQPVHDFLESCRRAVFHKLIHLRDGRRQPRQVERHAADETRLFLLGRGRESFQFQPRVDEGVDGIRRAGDRRHGRLFHRLKRPVPRPRRAFFHPTFEQLDLRGLERLVVLRRRHHVVLVLRGDAADQLALFQRPRHHRDLAGLPLAKRRVLHVEPQLGLALVRVRAVAGEAVLGKDRTDVAVEIELRRGEFRAGRDGKREEQRQGGKRGDAVGHKDQTGKLRDGSKISTVLEVGVRARVRTGPVARPICSPRRGGCGCRWGCRGRSPRGR